MNDINVTSANRHRVVLLGASNVTRCISTVVETAQIVLGADSLDVYAAIGNGRSYGKRSKILIRSIDGTVECGLWDAVEKHRQVNTQQSTAALITDIGNDILYGHDPEQIAKWIEMCIQRLLGWTDNIIVTELPLQRLEKMSARQYCAARSILFPSQSMSYEEALRRIDHLHTSVCNLADQYKLKRVQPRGEWYGIDPIHIQSRSWSIAWQTILRAWREDAASKHSQDEIPLAKGSISRYLRLRTARPARWWLLNQPRSTPQPATRLAGGTLVSLY